MCAGFDPIFKIKKEDTQHVGGLTFQLSRDVKNKLMSFAQKANHPGTKRVTWNDILEQAMAKLNESDLQKLWTLRQRKEEISKV